LAGVQAFLRRGVRPIATEVRVGTGGATSVRVEVNLPPPVRVASATIIGDEMARAGASTCAELTCAGRPAILVPYPSATDDHQTANAQALVAAGAAQLMPDW